MGDEGMGHISLPDPDEEAASRRPNALNSEALTVDDRKGQDSRFALP